MDTASKLPMHQRVSKMMERLHQNETCPNLALEGLLDAASQHLRTSETASTPAVKEALEHYDRLLVSLDDFDYVSKIGSGKFGSGIHLVREKLNSRLCVLKSVPRSALSQPGYGPDHVCTERTLLAENGANDWIPNLRFAFQCKESLHLVMDYFPGGDLRTLLKK